MALRTLDVSCDKCKHVNKRSISLQDPKSFHKDGTRSVLSQFWCQECNAILAIRYEFYLDQKEEVQVRIKSKIDSDKIAMPRSAPAGITIRPKAGKSKER